MEKIDKKDKKLIYELRRNCRQTYSRLSKSVGLSKQMIQYRINRLVRLGMLQKPIAAIDAGRLGYQNYGVYFQWEDDSRKDSFVEEILTDTTVRYAAESSGRTDFVISFYAKRPAVFQRIWDRYTAKYGTAIRSHSIHVSTENRAFDKSYLIGSQPRKENEIFLGSGEKTVGIDENDMSILKELTRNCRASIISIARRCGLSPDTVKSRIKRMEKEGLIQGYVWEPDLGAIGITSYELLLSLTNMDQKRWGELRSYCRSNPNITYFIRSIGKFDVTVIFEVDNDAEFDTRLHKLRKLFSRNIHDFEIVKIVKEHRFKYAPFL